MLIVILRLLLSVLLRRVRSVGGRSGLRDRGLASAGQGSIDFFGGQVLGAEEGKLLLERSRGDGRVLEDCTQVLVAV